MGLIPSFRRYRTFFVIGAFVEASRLLCFAIVLENRPSLIANIVSLVFRIIVAFILHATITWRERPGKFGAKFMKFSINQGVTSLVKTVLFPFWLLILPCPLYSLVYEAISIAEGITIFDLLSKMVSCELLSLASMDTFVYLTLGFTLHNWISFATERKQFPPKSRT